MIAALTADGFIGRSVDHLATSWTSKEDTRHFVKVSKELHCLVMGYNTYKTIGKGLPGRRTLVYSPNAIDDPTIEVITEDPVDLVRRLHKEGEVSLAICGGATIYNMFMQAGLVDELYLTVEPKLFGQGLSLFKDTLDKNLTLLDVASDANSVMLRYSIKQA
nr:Dihydrofolate reductase [uncultured bacterium]